LHRRIASPLPWLAGLLAVYLIAPLVIGVQQGLATARWSAIEPARLARACEVSLASATTATVLVALGGIPLGYLLARVPGRAMAALGFLVQLPLALPPLASGVLLLFLIGYQGPLGRLAGGALTDSFVGIVLAEAFVAAPFAIIAARSAFSAMDSELEGVARTLGHGPLAVFRRVSLPVVRPALISGLLLAWLRAFGEFGATVMVAYHPYSLPVYTYVAFGAQGLPAMLPVLVPALLLAFLVMGLSAAAAARAAAGRRPRAQGPLERRGAPAPRGPAPDRAPEPAPAEPLSVRLEKRLSGFHLRLEWSPRSRRLAILGPSGSGKSLTLKLIAGLAEPVEARVRLGALDLGRLAPSARSIGYVPQSYALLPHLDVLGQLRFPVGAERERASHWISRLGLTGLEHRRPAELSLGQQQRVALARALVRRSRLLLLDEPFSALDAPMRAALRLEFLALQRELAVVTVLVTHDPAEAALLADEILILDEGRLLQEGRTEEVFSRPCGERAARLLGADNAASGVVLAADRVALGGDTVLEVSGPPLRPGARVGWSFPPTRARLSDGGRYRGTVEDLGAAGLERFLVVRVGEARVRIVGGRPVARGAPCRFDIDPEAIQVWPS
jgi:ABC-type Fe3+/spermidine/putrescine transport system ATPase subunit/ABC-type sulfate transport system permease component